jgi:hypothetical protein
VSGQAQMEFVILCIVLLPLFLAIPLLGKYGDINFHTILANRYAAWERTVHSPSQKSDTSIRKEIWNRVMGAADTPVSSTDGRSLSHTANPLWSGLDHTPMLQNYQATSLTLSGGEGETSPGLVYNRATEMLMDGYNTVVGWLEAIGGVPRAHFEMNIHGMYQGQVRAQVAAQGTSTETGWFAPLQLGAVHLQRRANVIISDAWAVTGSGHGHHCDSADERTELCQVAPLLPTTALSGWFNDLVHIVGYVIPEMKQLDFGTVSPDEVPADREVAR